MTKKEFLKVLEEDLEITSVPLTPKTSIDEIAEWDSLAAMTALSVIDEHFGLDFSISEMNNLSTIDDILNIIGKDKFESD